MSHDTHHPKPKLGPLSPAVMLGVLLAALAVYLVFKTQTLEQRVQKIESTVSGTAPQQEPEQPVDINDVKAQFSKKGNMVFGDPKAKVLVVEFSDPSCPFCHAAAYGADEIFQGRFKTVAEGGEYRPPVQELRALAEAGKIGYVSLYANGHGNGELSTQALYCAYEQDAFWQAHDLLYSKAGYDLINDVVKNDTAKIPELVDFLSGAVNAGALSTCLQNGTYAGRIAEDMQSAQTLGFRGTPMFIVNTQKFAGAYSFAEMEPAINEALK